MRKRWIAGMAALVLAACSAETGETAMTIQASDLPVLGQAPELTNETWLNVEAPLRLADLRGRVVLLDMWTFG